MVVAVAVILLCFSIFNLISTSTSFLICQWLSNAYIFKSQDMYHNISMICYLFTCYFAMYISAAICLWFWNLLFPDKSPYLRMKFFENKLPHVILIFTMPCNIQSSFWRFINVQYISILVLFSVITRDS